MLLAFFGAKTEGKVASLAVFNALASGLFQVVWGFLPQ